MIDSKFWMQHLGAVFIMLIAAFVYFSPALQGKVLNQSDNIQAKGAQAELKEYRAQGDNPLWTNSMFAGMPAYQISSSAKGNYTRHIYNTLMLGQGVTAPHTSTFLMMLMGYLMLVLIGVDWRIALVGGIAHGLASNHIILIEAGHSTKVITLAYLPLYIAGAWLAFRGKLLSGAALLGLSMACQTIAGHVQITYYLGMIIGLYVIFEGVKAVQGGTLLNFAKALGVIAALSLVGVATNTAKLWTTYEYADESQRGKSDLTPRDSTELAKSEEGLTKDYAFSWSYGISETMNLLIPNFKGGSSRENFVVEVVNGRGVNRSDTESSAVFRKYQSDPSANSILQKLSGYWGDQPFTEGPFYFGAVICLLFVLGLILVEGHMKWWAITSFIFVLMISWGRNFFINDIFFDYVPMFNKFRSVSMILDVGYVIVILMVGLGLKELSIKGKSIEEKTKAVLTSGAIVGGLCVLSILAAWTVMGFTRPNDFQGIDLSKYPDLLAALMADRQSLLVSDALRSLFFVVLATGVLWAFTTRKIKWIYALVAVGLLSTIDLWQVDRRYASNDDFQEKRVQQQMVSPRPVDLKIEGTKQQDPHFRVLDISRGRNPYEDAIPSYFHSSLGGYSAAKMMLYQDFMDRYIHVGNLTANMARLYPLLGMLNTKYIIINNQGTPMDFPNPNAMGNAWFVNSYDIVENADQEMEALASLPVATKAVVQQKYAAYLEGLTPPDSAATASVRLTEYHPDRMVYSYNASSDRLLMFSEVYYPPEKGWNIYINGEKQPPFIKANYLLRAMKVPAGSGTIEMKFEPRAWYTGVTVNRISSAIILLAFFAMLYFFYTNYQPSEAEEIDDPVEKAKKVTPTKSKRNVKKPKKRKKK